MNRAQRLIELLPDAGIDALLVTNLVNVRYLTGYTGTNGLALIGRDIRVFITDFRYVEQAAEEVEPSFEQVRAPQDLLEAIADALPDTGLRLGFEDAQISVREYRRLSELLRERAELLPAGNLVEQLRAVKEPDELDRIRAATVLADRAFEQLLAGGLVGRSERELAMSLEEQMRMLGAQRPSFDTIVAAGPQGALPHAKPRNHEILAGELVVIDWGAELDGYCSDCTRTVAAGQTESQAAAVYDLVLAAQLTGVEAVRAGAECREVDRLARDVIDAAGHGEHFGHGLGHGVGIEVHEAPRLAQRAEGELRAGNVVTVEPGIYLPGQFGIRIEDLVVVTSDGCEIFTSVPKELTVVN
jgi:Xaa-Pro aminopeptidase